LNPIPPHSDNLFIRCYNHWREKGFGLRSKLTMLAVTPLLLALLGLGLAKQQVHNNIATQADRVGAELARQIASSLADSLAAGDQLSLNLQLAQWSKNPLIAHTRVYNADNRMIAEAGQRNAARIAPGQGHFNAAIQIQDVMEGQVQLSLSATPFASPAQSLISTILWALIALLIASGLAAWRMAHGMTSALQALGAWHTRGGTEIPGLYRSDEIGALARQMLTNTMANQPQPEPEPEIDADTATPIQPPPPDQLTTEVHIQQPLSGDDGLDVQADIAASTAATPAEDNLTADSNAADEIQGEGYVAQEHVDEADSTETMVEMQDVHPSGTPQHETALLAVRLGNQDALKRLPRNRLMALLDRYRTQLEQACQLYNGHLHTLIDGTSLMLFHARECRQDELTHALCCGELIRVLGHDLQVEIADTGITLHLQLTIGHAPCMRFVEEQQLADQPACQTLFEQIGYSRNLLLLEAELANQPGLQQRAVVRRLASQPGVYCIERLQDPYQSMLEQQLSHLYRQRQH